MPATALCQLLGRTRLKLENFLGEHIRKVPFMIGISFFKNIKQHLNILFSLKKYLDCKTTAISDIDRKCSPCELLHFSPSSIHPRELLRWFILNHSVAADYCHIFTRKIKIKNKIKERERAVMMDDVGGEQISRNGRIDLAGFDATRVTGHRHGNKQALLYGNRDGGREGTLQFAGPERETRN